MSQTIEQQTCAFCDGEVWLPCQKCGGDGEVVAEFGDQPLLRRQICTACGGTGEEHCPVCDDGSVLDTELE